MSTNELDYAPVECRICHSKTTRDLILSPCLCKGSMAYVHFRCLERWLNYSSRDSCELCSCKFDVILNRRYSCMESVRVWLRHPNNRAFILCDLAIGMILTSLTLALALVCFISLNHFVKEGYDQGIQSFWSEGIIDFFLMILLAGYLATMYSMARDHIRPWYRWWKNCYNVRLIPEKIATVASLTQESSESILANKRSGERHIERAGDNVGIGDEAQGCTEGNRRGNATRNENSESISLPMSEEIVVVDPHINQCKL